MQGILDKIIEEEKQRESYSLAQEFYCDGATYAADWSGVFERHWLLAGHATRLAGPIEIR